MHRLYTQEDNNASTERSHCVYIRCLIHPDPPLICLSLILFPSMTTPLEYQRKDFASDRPLSRTERVTTSFADLATLPLEAIHELAGLLPIFGYQVQAVVNLGLTIIRIIQVSNKLNCLEFNNTFKGDTGC